MTDRKWFNVGVVKIPHAQRDVAHDVLGARPGKKRWADIVGANTRDDDEQFPVGAHCTYRAALTDDEARQFREASNCRYVSEDIVVSGVTAAASTLPGWRCRSFTGYWSSAPTDLPGTTVPVAVLDSGTSSAARTYMGHTLAGRTVTVSPAPPTNENYPGIDHGSLCAGNAVPPGGQLLDAVMIDANDSSTDSAVATAITWAVGAGAKVLSGSFTFSSVPMPATRDALVAMAGTDVVAYFAMANEGLHYMPYPARYSIMVPLSYVYTVGGYDMSTGYRWQSSTLGANYHESTTGAAPSVLVRSILADATETEWLGTSAAVPQVANMAARLIGGGVTARNAAAALADTAVDHGPVATSGGKWFDLRAAAEHLHLVPAAAAVAPSPTRSTAAWLSYA